MYWADWSRNRPKIEVANMDGTDRRVLVKSPLSLPNGLTLVHSTNELCYSDAGMWAISCVNLGDLTMRKAYNPAPYPFGITNFNRTLFWTDWTMGRIQRMGMNSKIPDKPLRSFVGSSGKIFDIKAVQPCGRTGETKRSMQLQYDVSSVGSKFSFHTKSKERKNSMYLLYKRNTTDSELSQTRKTVILVSFYSFDIVRLHLNVIHKRCIKFRKPCKN